MNTIHPDPNTYVADIQALARISGAQLGQAEHAYKKAERSFDDALIVLKTWGYTGPPPIDMVLHCPSCGVQHIDAPEGFKATGQCECDVFGSCEVCTANEEAYREFLKDGPWTNPPHRSHLCAGCGHIWRPADVPTNGVAEIRTKGKNDSQRQEDVTVAAYRSPEEPAAFTEWWKREYAKDKGLFRGARAGYLQAWFSGSRGARNLLNDLHELIGYVEDGSSTTLRLHQDDATKTFIINVGSQQYYGGSIGAAIEQAIKAEKR